MKKVKGFNVGDKVFAKVKGYPAWPAIITEALNTKYSVKFYGTGETGSVKTKDIFYYLKNKKTFVKSLKRKDYNDAIEEIELAIKECGTDGNNEEELDSTVTSINDSVDSSNSKSSKRKRSSSISSEKLNEVQAKKKQSRSTTPGTNTRDSESKEEEKPVSENNGFDVVATEFPQSKTTKLVDTDEKNQENVEETPSDLQDTDESRRLKDKKEVEGEEKVKKVSVLDFNIISDNYLQSLIAYAGHVKKNEELYRKRPIEKRIRSKNEIVIAKLPEGKNIGIKYNQEGPPPMKNELEYAEYEESEAKTILSLKKVVEEGSCKLEDDPNLFITNLDVDETQLHDKIQMDLIERKKVKLKWLRIEANLLELDTKIKGCLGLDKASPETALDHLHTMLKLEVDPLMLKKHPHVVDMIKRLRRYIGNVKEWDMTEDESEEFEISADKVKAIADDVYTKFAKLFAVTDPSLFWDEFTEKVKEFKNQVKDMQEGQIFALSAEPYSRQSFFDEMDAKEELQLIALKIEETKTENKPKIEELKTEIKNIDKEIKPEKEGSLQVAKNTEENQGNDNVIKNSNSPS